MLLDGKAPVHERARGTVSLPKWGPSPDPGPPAPYSNEDIPLREEEERTAFKADGGAPTLEPEGGAGELNLGLDTSEPNDATEALPLPLPPPLAGGERPNPPKAKPASNPPSTRVIPLLVVVSSLEVDEKPE